MLRQIRLAQPNNRQSWHAIFPKEICDCFGRPDVVLNVCRWKRAKRGNDGRKNITGKRLTREKRDAVFRSPNTRMSIQQKTDSFRAGNRRSPACALNELGDGRNGDEFAAGNFISPAHGCRAFDIN